MEEQKPRRTGTIPDAANDEEENTIPKQHRHYGIAYSTLDPNPRLKTVQPPADLASPPSPAPTRTAERRGKQRNQGRGRRNRRSPLFVTVEEGEKWEARRFFINNPVLEHIKIK